MSDDHLNRFDELGRYILVDYDQQRPFSSFLPGIAGLQGIPMWVFYVNRGQAVCSFGVEDKDHPIVEFQPANKAYQSTALLGFRTFLNGFRGRERWHREAFSPWRAEDAQRTMFIGMNEVEIQEINERLGYQINIHYYMLTNMPIAALVRRVSLRNLHNSRLNLEVLDGLPAIVPYGVDNEALKNISRTIEAWMQVENLENNLPYYRLKASPGDTAVVQAIQSGHFGFAFCEDGLLPPVADPSVIFGLDTSTSQAHLFHNRGLGEVLASHQVCEGRTLCAFFGASIALDPGGAQMISSLYGYSPSLLSIQSRVESLRSSQALDQKLFEIRQITEDLTAPVQTHSASPTFDGYCRQTFLDNVLRGGYPLVLGGKHITHVYARKHGDLERDYNYFVIPPEYYSQGNGNYRDVNQNRRNDVFFVPQAGEFNIRVFMSLIQSDGYNPLVLNGLSFSIPAEDQADLLAFTDGSGSLAALLQRRFTPGELLDELIKAHPSIPLEDLFEQVFSRAQAHLEVDQGEGYWIDHWVYNLDLIESFLAIYPDKKQYLLYDSEPLPFYDSSIIVQPRAHRFVLHRGKPKQLNAVVEDAEKVELIQSRGEGVHWARADFGKGEVFRLPMISKLALLALIKFATLDPCNMGIQMEAGRPGWYDALNGLPGLLGSSMPETCELLRLIDFLSHAFEEHPHNILLPVEAQMLLEGVSADPGVGADAFAHWEKRTDALEAYRESTRMGFDGRTLSLDLNPLLALMGASLKQGIAQAHTFTGEISPTYFIYAVTDYDFTGTQDAQGNPHIRIKHVNPVALPPFLEGAVRLMKISDQQNARALAQAVKKSELFDRKLGLFKVNAPLIDQPHEIGRARAFTPGWLENESIWMHMAFKYLLELLNAGLFDEYFEALQSHLPAFMDPGVYGRSPLENSSFIVSSAHPDPALHGAGFVARLSGSTAEFLSLWVLMTVGKQPFRVESGEVVLAFKPILPGWLFMADGTFRFQFLGGCQVTYHNPSRLDTWEKGAQIHWIELRSGDETIRIKGGVIGAPYAESVRRGKIDSIELFFPEKGKSSPT